jgi:putative transposase
MECESLEHFLETTEDVREYRRALSIKLAQTGVSTSQICEVLGISPQYVSKWKHRFQNEGMGCLRIAYRGSQGFLTEAQKTATLAWIKQHASIRLDELWGYLEENYGITYQSKQSYYDLLDAGGMSYHRTEKQNPRKNEALVQERRVEIKKNWTRSKTK